MLFIQKIKETFDNKIWDTLYFFSIDSIAKLIENTTNHIYDMGVPLFTKDEINNLNSKSDSSEMVP